MPSNNGERTVSKFYISMMGTLAGNDDFNIYIYYYEWVEVLISTIYLIKINNKESTLVK